jgi:hypothetical protein
MLPDLNTNLYTSMEEGATGECIRGFRSIVFDIIREIESNRNLGSVLSNCVSINIHIYFLYRYLLLRINTTVYMKMLKYINIMLRTKYPASKVLSYFFSAEHREARETLQNLCINSFEHARRLLSNCLFPRRRFNK